MIAPAMVSLALALSAAGGPAAEPPAPQRQPQVKVWLSSDGDYRYGDQAKAYAQAKEDGYLVVLHADAKGHVRVLFPLDPADDQFVRAGKKHELKGRGDRAAFVVDDTGRGVVLAAFSKTRFEPEKFVKNGHWDYRALSSDSIKDDPEAGLMDIVREMQPAEHYSFDVASYVVSGSHYAGWRGRPYGPWWDGWYGPRVGVSLRFGRPFYYGFYGRPYFGYPYHGWWW